MIINVYYVDILFVILQIKRKCNIVYLLQCILLHINGVYDN